jgi:hypothetical protein
MSACGLSYPARPPALSRLAHVRAVLAVRLWLETGQAYRHGQAWWRSERDIRAALPSNAGAAHIADAEVAWPSIDGARFGGQTWAIEVELTPKPLAHLADHERAAVTPPLQPGRLPRLPGGPPGRGPRRQRTARRAVGPGRDPRPARHGGPARGAAVKVWSVLQIIVALWLLRKLLHLLKRLVTLAVLAVAWPVTLVGALGFGMA